MPALQVVGGMLATLGDKHSTVVDQVCATLVYIEQNFNRHIGVTVPCQPWNYDCYSSKERHRPRLSWDLGRN